MRLTLNSERTDPLGGNQAQMGTVSNITKARFAVGDLIHHRLFDYRGVIVDVDPGFQASDEWYEAVAKSRPPKDKPWYHVLVHEAAHTTYVAERNLEPDESTSPIVHPMTDQFFTGFENGKYVSDHRTN
jgi:heat shock protein HspQ